MESWDWSMQLRMPLIPSHRKSALVAVYVDVNQSVRFASS